MADVITARVVEDSVSLKLAELTPAVMNALERQITIETMNLAADMVEKYPESGLHVITGALRRSIQQGETERTDRSVTGSVLAGQGLPYARIQEYGGEVHAKNTKYLAIPLDAVKTMAGVAKYGPREAEEMGWDSTFVRRSAAGNLIIYGKYRGDNAATPLFLLKESVTIPARPYFFPVAHDDSPDIIQHLNDAVMEAVRGGA